MKKLSIIALTLFTTVVMHSQEKNIETESVTLDNLITFVVEHFRTQEDSTETKNITFLIETYGDEFNLEDKVILKQAFKLLSKRISEDDLISIVTYSNINGIALRQEAATDIKKLLYVIEHPKSSVKTFEDDGIELAYEFTKENFVEDSENSVIMIRIPNRTSQGDKTVATKANKTGKNKGNAVVLTAITLLPELIAVIKN